MSKVIQFNKIFFSWLKGTRLETKIAINRIAKLEGSRESTQAGISRLGCPFKVPTADCSGRKKEESALRAAPRKMDEACLSPGIAAPKE